MYTLIAHAHSDEPITLGTYRYISDVIEMVEYRVGARAVMTAHTPEYYEYNHDYIVEIPADKR